MRTTKCEVCGKKLNYDKSDAHPFDSGIIKNMLYYLNVERPYYHCEKCAMEIEKKFIKFSKEIIKGA